MQKSIFENFRNLTFWAIFTVIFGYFPYCKNRPKKRFPNLDFFWLRMFRGQTNVPRRSFRTILISWEHWFVPSTFSAKKIEIRKIGFLAYFSVRKIAQNYSKNGPKCQNSKMFKNRFLHNDPRYEHMSFSRRRYIPWSVF